MTPEQKQLFEQLGRNPAFRQWLGEKESQRISVLKRNTNIEQLCQAQGGLMLVDEMRAAAGLDK